MNAVSNISTVKTDAAGFRKIWRGFGSTIALVATEHHGHRHAMLATAVTSVSMDPPSLLVCVNRVASAHASLSQRGAFSLGLLPAEAHELGRHLAGASGAERFSRGAWVALAASGEATDGLPYLEEAQATLFCAIDATLDYGTHTIFVARVERVTEAGPSDPLLYCEGQYGRFRCVDLGGDRAG